MNVYLERGLPFYLLYDKAVPWKATGHKESDFSGREVSCSVQAGTMRFSAG